MTEDEKRAPSPETLRRRSLSPERRLELLEADKDAAALDRDELNSKWRGSVRAIAAMLFLLIVVGAIYGKRIDSNAGNATTAAHRAGVAAGKAIAAQKKATAAEKSLRAYEIATCKRGNERIVAENISQAADFRFFTLTAKLLKAALSTPPPGQPTPSPQQRKQTEDFVKGLEADARDKVWHHLIENCEYAVDHPRTYHLPGAVHFSKHRPPKGALEVQPGE